MGENQEQTTYHVGKHQVWLKPSLFKKGIYSDTHTNNMKTEKRMNANGVYKNNDR